MDPLLQFFFDCVSVVLYVAFVFVFICSFSLLLLVLGTAVLPLFFFSPIHLQSLGHGQKKILDYCLLNSILDILQ